jgi:hypothetical protein
MNIDKKGLHFITKQTKFCRQINCGDQSIVNQMAQIQNHATIKKN